jgi:hypothetical protein
MPYKRPLGCRQAFGIKNKIAKTQANQFFHIFLSWFSSSWFSSGFPLNSQARGSDGVDGNGGKPKNGLPPLPQALEIPTGLPHSRGTAAANQ